MSAVTGTVTPGNAWTLEVDGSLKITQTKLIQAATPGISTTLTNLVAAEDLQDDAVLARTLSDGIVGILHLDSTVSGILRKLTLTPTDDADGSGKMTIQAQDINGNSLAERFALRVWIASTDFAAPDGVFGFSVLTGTQLIENAVNEQYVVQTDSTGKAIMNIDLNGSAGTVYVMAEIGGKIYSGRAIITT